MLHWKEFSAWVTIDGQEAVEYNVETSEDEKSVTCWIASELGKKFTISWRNPSFLQDLAGYVKVDGNYCGCIVAFYRQHLGRTLTKDGVTDGTILKPFVFSSLELTDEDALLGASSLQELGLIKLTIAPVHATETNGPLDLYSLSHLKVHESSKKTVTQQVKLAEPEVLETPRRRANVKRAGPDIVKFCFKYRPIDVLRANGIAPSPPQLKRKASAEPLPPPPRAQTPDDSEALADLEEAKVLREKLNEYQAKLSALESKRLKKEKKPGVKREASDVIDLTQDSSRGKRVKLEGFVQGEVIDLT